MNNNKKRELNDKELGAIPKLKTLLSNHKGAGNAISSHRIMDQMINNGVNIGDGSVLRRMISHLRKDKLPDLAANSRGYYIETDLKKLKEYADSTRARAAAMISVTDSIDDHISKKRSENALNSQGQMFSKV